MLSEQLQEKVQEKVDFPVDLAMRYGSMTIKKGLQELVDKGVEEVFLIPLYPQFAMATTETILVLAEEVRQANFPNLKIDSLPAFYNKPDYIKVLAESIKGHLQGKNYEHLLFSYHGVPERHIRKSDITNGHCKIDGSCCETASKAHEFGYRHQCKEVTRLVGQYLGLEDNTYSTLVQSRLGFDPWLQPYPDRTIERLGNQGLKIMAIVPLLC